MDADRQSILASTSPEVVPNSQRRTLNISNMPGSKYYDPPLSAYEPTRSPVPPYRPYDDDAFPTVSSQSYHDTTSLLERSPEISSPGSPPMIRQSEIYSTYPEVVRGYEEKEVFFAGPSYAKVPSQEQLPTPGIRHQNSGDRPQVRSAMEEDDMHMMKRRPFYKRKRYYSGLIVVVVLVVVGIAVALILRNTKKSRTKSSSTIGKDNPNVDVNASVGGYINDAYYSKTGAFNGSGIAVAAANTEYNQAIYAFYQDYTGGLQYALMDPQSRWSLVGPVNAGSYKALNGTPLSTVQHQLENELVWHLFYIDEDYMIRERIITNTSTTGPSPIWTDGPLNSLNLKAWQSNTIGLQACYWGNYYGQFSYNGAVASTGIQLWYASDATTFQQYSWTNGTDVWTFDRKWDGLSGNGGVGCQTWDSGMVEYVWFVDTDSKIAMYWKDSDQKATATSTHPVDTWTKIDIGVDNVQKDSALGYTNFMIWQAEDRTIHGANVTWAAENTKIAKGNGDNGLDTWVLQDDNKNIEALRGTHMSITVVRTVSAGASMLVFFQEEGDDMRMYTRDAFSSGALWQAAAQDPVQPASS